MIEELFNRIVKGKYASVKGYVDGYHRFRVIGEVYPALVSATSGEQVHGLAYLDITEEDMNRLDEFEGDMYRRKTVDMQTELGDVLIVDTYLCISDYHHMVGKSHWEPGDFNAAAKDQFLTNFPGWKTN